MKLSKMLITHESPLCLLEESRLYNNYDYALVHLFDKYPEYRNFFINSLQSGREVILDNSVFELEEVFDMEEFYLQVCDLRPTYYIIPDSLEDVEKTKQNILDWYEMYNKAPGKSIGVVQGKTFQELVDCYQYIDKYCDMIAITHNYSYYLDSTQDLCNENKWIRYMEGRIRFIRELVESKIINLTKPHHLLGCSLPQEISEYREYDFIRSIDTSSPVVHAIMGIKYEAGGLKSKSSIKLVELLETPIQNIHMKLLQHNLKKFRKFSL